MEIGNGDFLLIYGIDIVRVQTLGGLKSISKEYYASKVSQNLISVGRLVNDNYELVFKDKVCTIKYLIGIELLTIGIRNKYFPLDWMKVKHIVYTCTLSDAELWYMRFDYVKYGSLKLMAS